MEFWVGFSLIISYGTQRRSGFGKLLVKGYTLARMGLLHEGL